PSSTRHATQDDGRGFWLRSAMGLRNRSRQLSSRPSVASSKAEALAPTTELWSETAQRTRLFREHPEPTSDRKTLGQGARSAQAEPMHHKELEVFTVPCEVSATGA